MSKFSPMIGFYGESLDMATVNRNFDLFHKKNLLIEHPVQVFDIKT
jgi:hypothetical protein